MEIDCNNVRSPSNTVYSLTSGYLNASVCRGENSEGDYVYEIVISKYDPEFGTTAIVLASNIEDTYDFAAVFAGLNTRLFGINQQNSSMDPRGGYSKNGK